jgi:hypothetical protein
MHGNDITIPKGHEVTVYTNTDYDPAKLKTPTATPLSSAAPTSANSLKGTPLTNTDVLKLIEAGLSEQVIIDKIGTSPTSFKLETDDLVELKKAGLSDALISAMLTASKH